MSAMDYYRIFSGIGDSYFKGLDEYNASQAAQKFGDAWLGPSPEPQQQGGLLTNLGRLIGVQQQPQASPASGPSLASLGQAYMPQQQQAPATAPAMQAINRVAPPEQIRSIIEANVPAQDREYYSRLIGKESSFNPSAISPTGAAGLGQFTRGTGRQYGLIDASGDRRTDPVANVQATVRLTENNRRALTDALGRPPTYGELALAHQQGAAGAISLLRGGAVPEQNLAVNNAGGMTGQAAANKIMAYYNMPGSQQAAPAQASQSAPVQVAQASGGMPSMPAQQQQRFTPEQAMAIRGLLGNKDTRAFGMQLLQQQIGPRNPMIVPEGASLYDPRTGTFSQPNGQKTTDQQRNYNFYSQQEIAAGREPQSFNDWQTGQRRAGATNINIDQKGEQAFEQEAGKATAKRFNDIIETGQNANTMLGDINQMREISQRVGSQGSAADIKAALGPYAEALGVSIDGLPDIQAFESVVQRLAPRMRAPGSGATSDIEFKGMLASLPRLRNSPAAREAILNTMEANARDSMTRAEIASKVMTKEITRGEGERQLRALPDPMTGFRQFRKENPQLFTGPAPTASTPTRGQAPTASGSAPVRVQTPDEARRLPKGTPIILPDGRQGVVP